MSGPDRDSYGWHCLSTPSTIAKLVCAPGERCSPGGVQSCARYGNDPTDLGRRERGASIQSITNLVAPAPLRRFPWLRGQLTARARLLLGRSRTKLTRIEVADHTDTARHNTTTGFPYAAPTTSPPHRLLGLGFCPARNPFTPLPVLDSGMPSKSDKHRDSIAEAERALADSRGK